MTHTFVTVGAMSLALALQAPKLLDGDWLSQGSFGLLTFVIWYMLKYGLSRMEAISEQTARNTKLLIRIAALIGEEDEESRDGWK